MFSMTYFYMVFMDSDGKFVNTLMGFANVLF
jgi:hypothetical protein